jgi:hypothetical protein
MAAAKLDFFIVIAVGLIASGLPYGYLIGLVVGTVMAYALPKLNPGFSTKT